MSAAPTLPDTGAGLSIAERSERGRQARKSAPRSSHAEWQPPPQRSDPIAVLKAQDADRVEFLVPIRHQRMGVSAFTFYRGTAAIMAGDLAGSPVSGLDTQICGDAHLSNFGGFASPERDLMFDCNDFDETLVGPWEWDLKRLAASLVLAGRAIGLGAKGSRGAARRAVEGYRDGMRELARMRTLDLWYDRVRIADVEEVMGGTKYHKRLQRGVRKAKRRTSLRSFKKLAEVVDGKPRIRSDPPLLVPLRELAGTVAPAEWEERVRDSYEQYLATLSDEVGALLERYEMVDAALKVVGVGSVGTRCFVALMIGRDEDDPLLLQVKEAGASVLEAELGPSRYENSGRRVVEGQRLMQAFGDIFLGWSRAPIAGRDFYWRQLKDMKGSVEIETMDRYLLTRYAGLCGWTLARGHARAGDPVAIAAYLGKSDTFGKAIARFAERYADQAEADHRRFHEAIDSGELATEVPDSSPIQS